MAVEARTGIDQCWDVYLPPDEEAWYLISWKESEVSRPRVRVRSLSDDIDLRVSEQIGGRDREGNAWLYLKVANADSDGPAFFQLECIFPQSPVKAKEN